MTHEPKSPYAKHLLNTIMSPEIQREFLLEEEREEKPRLLRKDVVAVSKRIVYKVIKMKIGL